ncbi:hypothetical protein, partial [Maioricimonas sp. JC845]|uniref:hypothetical protein n=1 Tax=Maioricimonas sp. JC845 TaxID=3232138 RepID=UPI003457F127
SWVAGAVGPAIAGRPLCGAQASRLRQLPGQTGAKLLDGFPSRVAPVLRTGVAQRHEVSG